MTSEFSLHCKQRRQEKSLGNRLELRRKGGRVANDFWGFKICNVWDNIILGWVQISEGRFFFSRGGSFNCLGPLARAHTPHPCKSLLVYFLNSH